MHNRIRHAIHSIYYASKKKNAKETLHAASQDTEVEYVSLDTLRELLTFVGQVQAELQRLNGQNIADNGRTNIDILRRENERLKEVLSELDRLISEKL